MLGIHAISSYLPEQRISNYQRMGQLGFDDSFIENKIGVKQIAVKGSDENTSDLCVRAIQQLVEKEKVDLQTIEVLLVVTQNPDANIPHTSAIVHGKLGLPEQCAAFDISLGCSGFVYGLSTIQSFMNANQMRKGILLTADPYSKIVDKNDKNTASLFGDAATATLVSDSPIYVTKRFTFGTIGQSHDQLQCIDGTLQMNGRGIFNFAAKYVPTDVHNLLAAEKLSLADIDRFIFHQGSKYIVDTIAKRLKIEGGRAVFGAQEYGNTVSSSIPLILENDIGNDKYQRVLISGFGVGLSWASTILYRVC